MCEEKSEWEKKEREQYFILLGHLYYFIGLYLKIKMECMMNCKMNWQNR